MTRRHTDSEIHEIKQRVRARDGMRCTQCGLSNAEHLEQVGKSLATSSPGYFEGRH